MRSRLVAIFFSGLLISGCALSRGEIDIAVPESSNPESALTVKLTEVTDRRVFEVDPKQPNIPSLKEDEENDRSVEKRAIARKRNSYGAALGDILLPKGRTVEQVVSEALTTALRESGVRVVAEGEAGYDTARPLQAEITQFWAWFRPGFWKIAMEYEAKVLLKSDWPVAQSDREVYAEARLEGQMASSSEWRELFQTGIRKLIENVNQAIKKTTDQMETAPGKISQILF